MAIDGTTLDAHVNFAGTHSYGRSAHSFDGFSRVFAVATDFQAVKVSRSFNQFFVISVLNEAVVSPNQRTNAFFQRFSTKFFTQAAVDCFVNFFIAGENKGNVKDIHCGNDGCPTTYSVQAHVDTTGDDCVVHVFIVVQLASGINLNGNGAFRFFVSFCFQSIHCFYQRMAGRKSSCHFQGNFLVCLFISTAATCYGQCHCCCQCCYCEFFSPFHNKYILSFKALAFLNINIFIYTFYPARYSHSSR